MLLPGTGGDGRAIISAGHEAVACQGEPLGKLRRVQAKTQSRHLVPVAGTHVVGDLGDEPRLQWREDHG